MAVAFKKQTVLQSLMNIYRDKLHCKVIISCFTKTGVTVNSHNQIRLKFYMKEQDASKKSDDI